MKCPSCEAAVDFRRETCSACGTAYLDALEKKAAAALPSRERSGLDRRQARTGRARVWAAGLAAAAAAVSLAGILAARHPSRSALPPGALRHEAGFAFVPPNGWALSSDGAGVRLAQGSASIRIWRAAGSLPEQPAELAAAVFNGGAVRPLSSAEVDLAGLPALRVEVAGERVVLPSAEAGRRLSALHAPAPAQESGELRGLVVCAREGDTTLLIQVFSESSDFARRRAEIEGFLSAVRTTR